ncbi:hypothetical protein AVEN_11836-1 [Araneus ventricosus]|uniref:Uncharacterized protein n=1 Tax=Araneus ventricosus TaxID=182803 RepID=A0A4Y2K701_ARAVE|nr:hypothetical protein AVEN_11836-1 [Araneus ventricosus]
MKLQKLSGAAFRKLKKSRVEAKKNNEGISTEISQQSVETFSTAANPAATDEECMAPTSNTVEFISPTTNVSNVIITGADKREDTTTTSTAVECTTLEGSEVILSNLAPNDNKHMEERNCDDDLKDN